MSAPATRLLLVLFRAFFWSDCVRLLVVPDDFLAKMGFVPPPPPPPWGFNKDGNSTAEIEERVMRYALSSALCSLLSAGRDSDASAHAALSNRRQLIPISDLPTTMMCKCWAYFIAEHQDTGTEDTYR